MVKKDSSISVVTTRNLSSIMLNKRVIPVPIYTEKEERRLIIDPRGTIYGQKAKKRNKIKL